LASNRSSNPRKFRPPIVFLLLSLPAVVLAAGAALAFGCGGGSNGGAESAIARLLEIGQAPGTANEVLIGKLPPGLPNGLPEYPGSKLIGSTVTTSGGAQGLGVLRETGDPVDKVYAYYEQALDTDPWAIQISSFPDKTAGVQFVSVNDPNIAGAVIVQAPSDGSGSLIFLSVQQPVEAPTSEPFQLEPSKPLPPDWPSLVSLYPDATVTGTAWGRSADANEWQISFLVQAAPADIINFYRTGLANAGFTVTDEAAQGDASLLSFNNQTVTETWSGGISAQTFADDPTYAQGTVQVSISAATAAQPPAVPTP
jgi:hypothetical protein